MAAGIKELILFICNKEIKATNVGNVSITANLQSID
jgi:hypothetical protein